MRTLGLARRTSLFLNDVKITKIKGFGEFNLACKWEKTYRGFKTKEPWFILTNLGNVEEAIKSYQKRFGIEEMFRDLKSGGYNLEGIQKYIVRPKSKRTSKRRHGSFYVGQHLHLWVGLQQIYEKTIQELMQISRHRLKNYVVGKRAIELAISVF